MQKNAASQDDLQGLLARAGEIADSVLSSGFRSHISRHLTVALSESELSKGRGTKDAIKRVKERLHQLLLSFEEDPKEYRRLASLIDAAAPSGKEAVAAVAIKGLALHASTRERRHVIRDFYSRSIAGLRPKSVIDLGCGLNPLSIPWMGLPEDARYIAADASDAFGPVFASFFKAWGIDGEFLQHDLTEGPPAGKFDVALMMKLMPTLDRIEPGLGMRTAREVDAPVLIVSFPTASLCGRNKGMRLNYSSAFEKAACKAGWEYEAEDFGTEISYTVRK